MFVHTARELRVEPARAAVIEDAVSGVQGIHLGAMAGSIDVVQRSFAGLRITPARWILTWAGGSRQVRSCAERPHR
ncbi:hypothetical protein [Arthrobacter sp. ISL-72]|uniref:hypothetical protein n=1 Tax=Arthrobacter sp. ISL-72 TaxID=2819114 RepID=UPI001BEA2B8B|nr:hypothetical protein [Arthrobacter sp. ISL-72]MBT2594115.1 hypothetical protein [Arthrobacter sp. ISL-72]